MSALNSLSSQKGAETHLSLVSRQSPYGPKIERNTQYTLIKAALTYLFKVFAAANAIAEVNKSVRRIIHNANLTEILMSGILQLLSVHVSFD